MSKRVIAIIQARTSSTRFPGKVLMPLIEWPMIIYQLKRIKKATKIDDLILATSDKKSDDLLSKIVKEEGFKVFRGELEDVLSRFNNCALQENADIVVRLTGDNPLTDPDLIDEIIEDFLSKDIDYLSNALDERNLSVPDGFDIEVFHSKILIEAVNEANLISEREHVTPWIYKNKNRFKSEHFTHNPFRKYYRLTVDEYNDFVLISKIVNSLHHINKNFRIDEIINLLKNNPDWPQINISTKRNEGYLKSINEDKKRKAYKDLNQKNSGQNFWERAKKVIPGGNMLLSKRAEMFLPKNWPAYYSRAEGCHLWDIDGEKFTDLSIMGIGTNILGYGDPEVDAAVASTVSLGNMSTLNCPEEVLLAEKLIEMHPWAHKVKFARTGGEANAISIRIARAATGKETVAICGYHGWHDWYLATNLEDDSSLSSHLLPGLKPNGVPNKLRNTVKPFNYNDLKGLQSICENNQIAAVKMEVERNFPPNEGFLLGVRKLCSEKNIPLIFDECTSGFRETFGGLHKKYGVEPDMAIFGKALGNGYAITAIIGKEELMDAAQSTFISSTFWTERIGPSAALKTLEVMEKKKSWEEITKIGASLKSNWSEIAKSNKIDIDIYGINALAAFKVNSKNWLKYKTFITQEMLKKGILAANSCYLCIKHNNEILENYYHNLDIIFKKINNFENGESIDKFLEGPVCHDNFKRLN